MQTDYSGAQIQDMAFYPWGQVWWQAQQGIGWNFASLPYWDVNTNTNTNTSLTLFRQYSMNLGRWMTPDPLGGDVTNPQSLNRYAYVTNNPTTYSDPLGLQGCSFNGNSAQNAANLTNDSLFTGPATGQPSLYLVDTAAYIGNLADEGWSKLKSAAEYTWSGAEIGLAVYGIVMSDGAPLAVAAGGASAVSAINNIHNEATGDQDPGAAGSLSALSGALSIVNGVSEKNPVEVGAGTVSLVSGACNAIKASMSSAPSAVGAGDSGGDSPSGNGQDGGPPAVPSSGDAYTVVTGTVTTSEDIGCPAGYEKNANGQCVKC